jgi:hypothetical protein
MPAARNYATDVCAALCPEGGMDWRVLERIELSAALAHATIDA